MGETEKANALLMHYDETNLLYELGNHLGYPYFDPRAFPNLYAVLKRQNASVREPIMIPFRCGRPEED